MSEILIETKNPTNLKTDSWYDKFAKVYSYSSEFLKERDIIVDKGLDYFVIEQSAIRFYHEFGKIQKINTLEGNRQFLEECKINLKSLGIKISPTGVINLCSNALQNGYLVSQLLRDIAWEIHCFKKNVTDIYKQFKFENYQKELYDFLESNIGWRNKERDFDIYMKIKKGTLYQEIAEKLGLTIPAISMINSKVQSSINNLKGKLFEIEYEKYLRTLDKFINCKIVRDGNPGKPDIYIIDDENNVLYIFSLKNLELNKNPYSIIVEELKPELQFAYENHNFGKYKKVYVYLIVFDSLTEKIHVEEIGFKSPVNVNIYH